MKALERGFLTAGAIHGALLTLWLGYELTDKIYRDNLRLDFTLTSGTTESGAPTTARTEQATSDAGQEADSNSSTPTNPGAQGPANGEKNEMGTEYAGQNMASISGLIHGRVYYPRIARKNNWQGRVLVHFVVGTDGRAHDVSLRESSGHQVLDQSALETIRELDGLPRPPVPVPLTVPVHFRLN